MGHIENSCRCTLRGPPFLRGSVIRIHKQATGLVWIGFLRPASPLRDSAGVSPDFAGLSTAHHFTDALFVTVAEVDGSAHNRVPAFTRRSQ